MSAIPEARTRSRNGPSSAMGRVSRAMPLLSQSYQPAGVIAIWARSYQPVATAASRTRCAFWWVLSPMKRVLPARTASSNARPISSLATIVGLCAAIT